ncbi:uncharacterized protein LOC120904379 isoform X1 [Anopheles arabiensis]|uniref:F-box domain-containing protein n=1 Tax=Anopheles arabiensis TaxID=7173 RepID=A0A182HH53_ANOAR|nr:uncharacterized protein LOC120904379 isoform X1 [Anopheles arabiensis]XP_320772.2 uncharacterized protein LOC1280902 [Anopheles gambiae]
MDLPDAGSPFDKLPSELIFSIFDYLELKSLKAVSLTCHRLEQMFADYSACRFVLRIREERNSYVFLPPLIEIADKVEAATKLLNRTKRCYRRVHLDVQYQPTADSIEHMQAVLDKLFAVRLMQQLTVLKLDLPAVPEKLAVQLSDAVSMLDSLQELAISYKQRDNQSTFSQLYIVNRSLHKLVLNCVWPGRINCPNMQCLKVLANVDVWYMIGEQYALHGDAEPYWKLKHLKELFMATHLLYRALDHYLQKTETYKSVFCQQLTQLKKLRLFHSCLVTDKVLKAICESCVHLENLSFTSMYISNPDSFRYISNLTNLRQLSIESYISGLSFAGVRLPHLKTLLLGNVNIDWPSLAKVESIESLMIKLNVSQVVPACDLFAGHMRRLRLLWIKFDININHERYREIFAALSKLPALETLVLHNVLRLDCLKEMVPIPRLTRLVVCDIFPKCISVSPADVAKRVPKVDRIEVPWINKVNKEMKQRFGCNAGFFH